MGLPTSWAILSLIHLWWCDEARIASGWSKKDFAAHIMGDDALLATDGNGALRYKDLVRMCGGSPSAGKHFESIARGQGAKVRAVFLERLYEFKVENSVLTAGNLVPVMPVKGVTGTTLPREFRGELPIKCRSKGII